jgi:hypothetical protein
MVMRELSTRQPITTTLRETGFNDQEILTFLLARFSDPQPLQILTYETIASLQSIHEYKTDNRDSLAQAYAQHLMTITAQAGRLLGSLKYVESNWDASLGTLAQSAYTSAETVRQRVRATLERLAEEESFVQEHAGFLSDFIDHFGSKPLEDPQTFPSRYVDTGERANQALIEIATECREEILQIPPDLVVKPQGLDIAGVILSLMRRSNVVQTLCRNRKSRIKLLSPSEDH